MSWGRGWYGWDVDSESADAWGPYETAGEARCHPDPHAPNDAEVRVFRVSVSDTPPPRRHGLVVRQSHWTDGPDSEAVRAARGEGSVPRKRVGHIKGARKVVESSTREKSGCWNWSKATDIKGYGFAYWNGKTVRAHRLSYESFRGPIPAGMTIDHLCMNTSCVNPDHMEVVTAAENTSRRYRGRTHCKRGHRITAENTSVHADGGKRCRACKKMHDQSRRPMNRSEAATAREAAKRRLRHRDEKAGWR